MKSFALLSIEHTESFSGYHLPVIAVMLPEGTITNKDIVDAINYEYSAQCEMYEDVEGMEQYIKEYCDNLMQSPDDLFAENEEDEDIPICAFFGIIEPKYINGIMFLS